MSDLPVEHIEKIAAQVKNEYKTREYRISPKSIVIKIFIALILVTLAWGIGSIAISIFNSSQDYTARKERQELERKYRELCIAAKSGNIEMVKYIIENDVPVDLQGWEHNTALMAAVSSSQKEVVEYILEKGADITIKNKEGHTALDIAEEKPNVLIRKLLAQAMVNASSEKSSIRKLWKLKIFYSQGSFINNVKENNLTSVKLFLEANQDKFISSWEKEGLKAASASGLREMTELILNFGKDITSEARNNALISASRYGNLDVIDILLEHGADINYKPEGSATDPEKAFTPLIWAIWNDNDAMEHLLKKGADPDKMGGYNEIPPISIPMYYSYTFMPTDAQIKQLKLLIEYGADINKKDEGNMSPLDWARKIRYDKGDVLVKILKDAGAEIPFTEDSFRELIYSNDEKNLKSFLKKGFDPNLQGFEHYDKQMTALIRSVIEGHYNIAKMLIEFGADVNFKTERYNRTALLMAVKNENIKMVKLLLKNNAEISPAVIKVVDNYRDIEYEPQRSIRKLINVNK